MNVAVELHLEQWSFKDGVEVDEAPWSYGPDTPACCDLPIAV